MIVSFLIPFDAIAIPLLSIFRGAGLENSFLGLILPGIGNGLTVVVLRSFFLGIPTELVDAARVEGLGWWGVFWRIYLPLSRPALIGAGLILFVFPWQAYLWPLLIAPDPDMKVVPVAIAQFAGQQAVDFGAIFAGATMTAALPLRRRSRTLGVRAPTMAPARSRWSGRPRLISTSVRERSPGVRTWSRALADQAPPPADASVDRPIPPAGRERAAGLSHRRERQPPPARRCRRPAHRAPKRNRTGRGSRVSATPPAAGRSRPSRRIRRPACRPALARGRCRPSRSACRAEATGSCDQGRSAPRRPPRQAR
jgi:hypothetical protein